MTTIMPGFYTLEVGQGVREKSVGKTILTAQQVEDVVAYLGTLKE
jgi:sulfur-oxidizing protein SoxX